MQLTALQNRFMNKNLAEISKDSDCLHNARKSTQQAAKDIFFSFLRERKKNFVEEFLTSYNEAMKEGQEFDAENPSKEERLLILACGFASSRFVDFDSLFNLIPEK